MDKNKKEEPYREFEIPKSMFEAIGIPLISLGVVVLIITIINYKYF